jgi:DDE superfamily endonuclease
MELMLDVYKMPYNEDFPVVCMDESPKQLIKETWLPGERKPGVDARDDFEYERCGVANIFMVNEPLSGKRFVSVTETKTKKDWAMLLKEIADKHSPNAEKIILISDNLSTHKPAALYDTFKPDRFELIHTPKHGSWLNMAEIELNMLMRQCLNRRIDNVDTMKKEVNAW